MPQEKRWECHRCRDRLEVTRGNGNDQSLDIALPDLLQRVSHGMDVPVQAQGFVGDDRLEGPSDKGREVAPNQFVDDLALSLGTEGT